jgi:hypothetical protein
MITSLQTNTQLDVGDKGDLMFKEIYNLLYALIKFKRAQIIHLIPLFSYCVDALVNVQPLAVKTKDFKNAKKSSIPCLQNKLNNLESGKLVVRLVEEMHQKPRGESDKPFTKHVPFLLTTLVHNPHAKATMGENWQLMGYRLLDSCDEYGRKYVLRNIKGAEDVYKKLVGEWEANHRYKGNA